LHRRNGTITSAEKENRDEWYKRPFGMVIIGITITVIGGLLLSLLL
jgi:hypothetical protein